MIYALALLAACANATSSVLQRKAGRRVPKGKNLSPKLIQSLLHEPVWFGGTLAVTVGRRSERITDPVHPCRLSSPGKRAIRHGGRPSTGRTALPDACAAGEPAAGGRGCGRKPFRSLQAGQQDLPCV